MAIFNLRWPGKKQQEGEQRTIRATRNNPVESVEAMRRRARHRLIGATVLVLLAIIGFPMLFDTQPRPVPVNASIEIPDRDKVAALSVPPHGTSASAQSQRPTDNGLDVGEEIVSGTTSPAGRSAAGAAAVAAGTAAAVASSSKPADKPADKPASTTTKPEPKPKDDARTAAKPEPKPEPKPTAKPETKPEPKHEAKPEPKPESKPKEEPKPKEPAKRDSDDAARIRAMMEGRTAAASAAAAAKPAEAARAPAASARYVVQVGAFAEADKAAEVRAKLQMAGVAAFTQTVKTSAGSRTRVRVGPFGSKEDADRAAAKVRAQGLPASLVPMQ